MVDLLSNVDKVGQHKLIRNALRCLDCKDVIESKHRHDFVQCTCGNVFVDGGLEYQRIGYKWTDGLGYENLSMYGDD